MGGWMVLTEVQGGMLFQTAVVATGFALLAALTLWLEDNLHLPKLPRGTRQDVGDCAPAPAMG